MVQGHEELHLQNGVEMVWLAHYAIKNADFTGFVGYKNCRCECYYVYQNTPYEWNKISEKQQFGWLFYNREGLIIYIGQLFRKRQLSFFVKCFVGSGIAREENASSTALKWRITPMNLEWWDTVVKDSRRLLRRYGLLRENSENMNL